MSSDPWTQLAIRFEQAAERAEQAEAMGQHRSLVEWTAYRASTADKLGDVRKRQSKADSEAEARREKRIESIAYEGPQMVRVARHSERRNTDCVRYSQCLDRFIARHCQRGEANAECPQPCEAYRKEDLLPYWRRHSNLYAGGEVK